MSPQISSCRVLSVGMLLLRVVKASGGADRHIPSSLCIRRCHSDKGEMQRNVPLSFSAWAHGFGGVHLEAGILDNLNHTGQIGFAGEVL